MGIFNDFPYSNLHDENLEWICTQLKKLNAFIVNNPNLDPEGFEKELAEIRANITNLENSISATDGKIDAVNDTISQIQNSIESINTKIDTITDQIESTGQKITSLESEVANVKNSLPNVGFYNTSYVVYVGDSYTAGPGSTDGRGWTDRLTSILPVGTRTYTVWNGGGGFTRAGDGGTMTQAVQNADIPDKDQVSLVICMAGINDDDASDVYTGVGNFITACRSLFPNARYIISGSAAPYIQSLKKYNSIAQSAIIRQASYFDLLTINLSVNNAYKSGSDDIHLNNSGYQNIANAMLSKMRGSEFYTNRQQKTTSKNGVNVTAISDNHGVWMQAAGIFTTTNTSGAIEGVFDLGARPKQNVGIFGGITLDNKEVTAVATRPTSCYITPAGALALPGCALQGATIDIYFNFIPWETFMA